MTVRHAGSILAVMAESRGSREFAAAVTAMGATEAARRLGVVPSMVSHLRYGAKRPSLALAVRIAAVLGVQPEAWEDTGEAPDTEGAA